MWPRKWHLEVSSFHPCPQRVPQPGVSHPCPAPALGAIVPRPRSACTSKHHVLSNKNHTSNVRLLPCPEGSSRLTRDPCLLEGGSASPFCLKGCVFGWHPSFACFLHAQSPSPGHCCCRPAQQSWDSPCSRCAGPPPMPLVPGEGLGRLCCRMSSHTHGLLAGVVKSQLGPRCQAPCPHPMGVCPPASVSSQWVC